MHLHSLRQETLATYCTATAQDVTAINSLATDAEAELTLACALGGLVGSFGHGLWRLK
jgi:hypothetical protein